MALELEKLDCLELLLKQPKLDGSVSYNGKNLLTLFKEKYPEIVAHDKHVASESVLEKQLRNIYFKLHFSGLLPTEMDRKMFQLIYGAREQDHKEIAAEAARSEDMVPITRSQCIPSATPGLLMLIAKLGMKQAEESGYKEMFQTATRLRTDMAQATTDRKELEERLAKDPSAPKAGEASEEAESPDAKPKPKGSDQRFI